MTKVIILAPCSGSKKRGGTTTYNENSSILNYLTSTSGEHLLSLRRKLFGSFSIPLGQDVGATKVATQINFMPAYERYTELGSRLYQRISHSSWNKLKETPHLDVVIISALYGLVRYSEPIQFYDLNMDKSKIDGQKLKTWWRKNGLGEILRDYINTNSVFKVHNVLSRNYNEAIGSCFSNMEDKCHFHNEFNKYGNGSNSYRGKWINGFIKNF